MKNRWGIIKFLLALILGFQLSNSVFAGSATLNLTPIGKAVEVGSSFTVILNINPGGASVDTARAHINFSAGLLEASSFSLSGKLSSASPGSNINNSVGTLNWGGFTVDNPITTSSSFGRITFRAKAVGAATISVVGDSKLISNGEEVGNPGGFNQITVKIVPSTADPATALHLTSPTHPDQEKWYQNNIVQLKWGELNVKQYLWEFDQSPQTIPSKTTTDLNKQIKNIKNGIWYFHLSQNPPTDINGPVVAHYKFQLDNLKPNPLEPYLDIGNKSELTLKFATTDYHSGIASYDVQVNQDNFDNATSPFALHGLNIGANFINVTAYDLAGNSRLGWIRFILDSDGTIRDTTTSGTAVRFCDTIPWACTNGSPVIGVGLLAVIIGLLLAFFWRRRVHTDSTKVIKTETETHTDPKTGKKIITEHIITTETKNAAENDNYGLITKNEPDPTKTQINRHGKK